MLRLPGIMFIIVLFCFGCNNPASVKTSAENFNVNSYKRYALNFNKKYGAEYNVLSLKNNCVDFINLYSNSCHTTKLISGKDYNIVQHYNAFWRKNDLSSYAEIRGCYYEILHFKNPTQMQSILLQIKQNYCVEPFNLKLSRIYHLGTNTIICLNNYGKFDIVDYEKFLHSEFNDQQIVVDTLENLSRTNSRQVSEQ